MRASWVWRVLFVLVVGDWDIAFVALAKWLATSGCDSLWCISCWSIWDFQCIGDWFVDVLAVRLMGVTCFGLLTLKDLVSVTGLQALVCKSFGFHCMVVVCLGDFVGVGEIGFVEGLVFLGLHWKRGFSLGVICGLGVGVGLGIELLGIHL